MHLFWNNIASLEKNPVIWYFKKKIPQKWINFFRLKWILKWILKFLKKKLYRFWRKKIIFTLLDLTTSFISLNDSNDNCELFFSNCLLLGMGGAVTENPGHNWWVAEGAVPVAVSGAYLLLRGHHAADAGGGQAVPDRGQELEGCDETHHQGTQGLWPS